MTSARKGPAPTVRREDGRYLRFSHRYNAWQVMDRLGQWRNIRVELARGYASAGFPVESTDVFVQQEMF